MSTKTEHLMQQYGNSMMSTYKTYPVVLEKGEGMYVTDAEGTRYLDFIAGIAVNALGHCHPVQTERLSKQIGTLIHCSNLFPTQPQIELAERLVKNSKFSKAFFCNSGTESIEAALKLARKYGKEKKGGAWKIIAMEHSFHGRTLGAVSVTGQKKYQVPFEPLLPGVEFVPFNNVTALEEKISGDLCAIIIEPVQGEGGIHPASREYLEAVRALCDRHDIILIFDEVQCGMGRSGKLFAFEHYGIRPDVVCMAKGLGGGFPIGAILCSEKADIFSPGDHAATFGGNPLACTAALTVLEELIDEGLLIHAEEMGKYLERSLKNLQKLHPDLVKEVRGLGLMMGIEMTIEASSVTKGCMERGLLLVAAGTHVVRFVPPLIVEKQDIDKAVDIVAQTLASAGR